MKRNESAGEEKRSAEAAVLPAALASVLAPAEDQQRFPASLRRKAGGHREGFNAVAFLANAGLGKVIEELPKGCGLFTQGHAADAIFYLQKGKVKLTVVSKQGKEATLALLSAGEFVGEECIANTQSTRLATATALTDCVLLKISKSEMVRVLREEHALSDVFVSFLLQRNARIQSDLVDHLFNSSEKRLARILLLLAQFGKEGKPEAVIPRLSQEVLAEMVGTTRSRISFFMNRFRKLGFIDYDGQIQVHSSLLNVVLHD
ncbi:MAG TPA: Crp/Fnr family transcriptional regulator [Terriglobales bacterium]|nr:Crp/Fnr family transcriptional regulator [Terriglobales bacterium]